METKSENSERTLRRCAVVSLGVLYALALAAGLAARAAGANLSQRRDLLAAAVTAVYLLAWPAGCLWRWSCIAACAGRPLARAQADKDEPLLPLRCRVRGWFGLDVLVRLLALPSVAVWALSAAADETRTAATTLFAGVNTEEMQRLLTAYTGNSWAVWVFAGLYVLCFVPESLRNVWTLALCGLSASRGGRYHGEAAMALYLVLWFVLTAAAFGLPWLLTMGPRLPFPQMRSLPLPFAALPVLLLSAWLCRRAALKKQRGAAA